MCGWCCEDIGKIKPSLVHLKRMLERGNIEAEAKERLVRSSLGRAKSQPKGIGMCKGPEPEKKFVQVPRESRRVKGRGEEEQDGKETRIQASENR